MVDSGLGFVQPMFFVGVVEDRDDPRVEGRVRVRAFGVHGSNRDIPTEELPWATLIIGNHDVNFTPPPLNSWVFGFFIDGRDAQQPMILGLIPSQSYELVEPEKKGWGTVPAEDYDLHSQGTRPRDLGLSPLSNLATGEFLNETYNQPLETNRARNIPIAGGCANYYSSGNGNSWGGDNNGEYADENGRVSTRGTSVSEKEIYQGLIARGFTDAQAKGIISQMIMESGLVPGINEGAPLVKGSRGGFGLIQWTGERRVALERAAAAKGVSPSNLNFQLDFLMQEFNTTHKRSYNAIKAANTPVQAANAFLYLNLGPLDPNKPSVYFDRNPNLRPALIRRIEGGFAEARRLAQTDLGGGTTVAGTASDTTTTTGATGSTTSGATSSATGTASSTPTAAQFSSVDAINERISEINMRIADETDKGERDALIAEKNTLTALKDQKLYSIDGIGDRIAEIDKQLDSGIDSDKAKTLIEEKKALAALKEEKLVLAEKIRARIAEIDKQLDTEIDSDKAKALVAEKKALEEELKRLEYTDPVDGSAGDPYGGYDVPSSDMGCAVTWDEPASGYGAKYPFNRVMQTAGGHSIEFDDTPGEERIMIWHKSGSYIQITNSATTHKNMGDYYGVNEGNHHVYVGGTNIVTIEGDSHVLVKGNKVEEIVGDYKQIVHGNIMVGGAGRVEINGADRTHIRGSTLGLDSSVENLDIRTGKNIVFESGESINLKSKNIRIGASQKMSVSGETGLFLQAVSGDVHLKSKGNTFMNPEQNLYLKTDSGSVFVQSEGPLKMNSASSFVSINAKSIMNLGATSNVMIASKGGSVNLNAAENLGLVGNMAYLQGKTDVNIKASSGNTNIGARDDLSIIATAGKMFAEGATGIDMFSGAAMKVQADSGMDMIATDMRLHGYGSLNATSSLIVMDSSGAMSAKGESLFLEGTGNFNLKGGGFGFIGAGTVHINDNVQLASGVSTTEAFSVSGSPSLPDPGNEAQTKEEIQPAKFDDADAETPGGSEAGQAMQAEQPTGSQSKAVDPSTPPDRHPPNPDKVTPIVVDGPTAFA